MSVNKSLFQIGKDMEALDRLLDELAGDVSGKEEIIEKWFEENEKNLSEKIDGYAFYCEELKVRAQALKEKQKQLKESRRVLENRMQRLKDHLQYFLETHDLKQVEGKTRRAQLQRAGGRYPVEVRVDRPEKLPEKFRVESVTYKPDYEAILEAAGNRPGPVKVDGQVVAVVQDRGRYVQFY